MKNLILVLFILFAATLYTTAQTSSQTQYVIIADSAQENVKMLKGIIDKNVLENDTSFNWYADSRKIYKNPDADAVAAFKNNRDKIYFIIFGGTWCEDTHFVLPKFFKIQEVADFPEDRIALFAVDRNKTTTGNIAKVLDIINVPTIIVMKDGKELGRVVEYGKTGKWDKELADIINEKSE